VRVACRAWCVRACVWCVRGARAWCVLLPPGASCCRLVRPAAACSSGWRPCLYAASGPTWPPCSHHSGTGCLPGGSGRRVGVVLACACARGPCVHLGTPYACVRHESRITSSARRATYGQPLLRVRPGNPHVQDAPEFTTWSAVEELSFFGSDGVCTWCVRVCVRGACVCVRLGGDAPCMQPMLSAAYASASGPRRWATR
jgi:hypothetical protein